MLSILSILLFEWNLLIANPAKMTQEASKVAVHRHESLTNRLIEGGMLTQAQRKWKNMSGNMLKENKWLA